MHRHLCSQLGRIHCVLSAVNDVFVERVLGVGCSILHPVEQLRICLVLGEQNLGQAFGNQPSCPVVLLVGFDNRCRRSRGDAPCPRLASCSSPRPCIAKP